MFRLVSFVLWGIQPSQILPWIPVLTHHASRDLRTRHGQGKHDGDNLEIDPHHVSLAHAVSEDFSMHGGLAREFRARYGRVEFLRAQRKPVGTCAVLPLKNRYIFYLVTKPRFYNKPTYSSVRAAFQSLKRLLNELELTQIALPGHVCCGLDKLNWGRIKQILREVFAGSGIVVHVFHIW